MQDFMLEKDPYALYAKWFQEAEKTEPSDPNAVSIASVDKNGLPDVRIVLIKEWDERGFVFYTNLESAKGKQILSSGKVGAVLHWKSLKRQIRFRGEIERVSSEQSDAYFHSRPHASQLGARASQQSRDLASREVFEAAFTKEAQAYPEGTLVPRPDYWGGIRVKPECFEFWQDQQFRLHDRLRFDRDEQGNWVTKRLYP